MSIEENAATGGSRRAPFHLVILIAFYLSNGLRLGLISGACCNVEIAITKSVSFIVASASAEITRRNVWVRGTVDGDADLSISR